MGKVEEVFNEIRGILNKSQLNQIYLISCIQDVQENKEGDGIDNKAIKIQYLKNIQKVLENKEEYEICQKIKFILDKIK